MAMSAKISAQPSFTGFMEFVAKPLFIDWHRYMHSDLSAQMMRNLLFNCQQWTDLLETEVSQRAAMRSDSGVFARPLVLQSGDEARSSLQEMADLELQSPDILAQRRMSASGSCRSGSSRRWRIID